MGQAQACLPLWGSNRAVGLTVWLLSLSVGLTVARADSDAESATSAPVADTQGPAASAPPSGAAGGEPSGYSEAIEAGIKEHARGNYQEARAHFERAHELFPNARSFRGLGKVEYELRNYGDAVRHLQEALASNVRPLDDELRQETQRLLERARVYVGEIHVNVEPGSATVSVDGITMATGPKASLSLLVGDHVLEFRAQGRVPERRSIRISGGEQRAIQVVLAPPLEATGAAARVQDDRRPLHKQWWLWAGVAIVAGAVVAGVAIAATRSPERREIESGTTGVVLRNP